MTSEAATITVCIAILSLFSLYVGVKWYESHTMLRLFNVIVIFAVLVALLLYFSHHLVV